MGGGVRAPRPWQPGQTDVPLQASQVSQRLPPLQSGHRPKLDPFPWQATQKAPSPDPLHVGQVPSASPSPPQVGHGTMRFPPQSGHWTLYLVFFEHAVHGPWRTVIGPTFDSATPSPPHSGQETRPLDLHVLQGTVPLLRQVPQF